MSFLLGAPCPPKWIDDEPKVSKPTLVATMAGLLLHAVAGMPASGSCTSHSATVPLLSPSTPRTPLTPSLFALSLSCCLCTSLVFSEDGQFVETLVAATFWVAALSRSLRRTCSLSWGSSSRCELGALDSGRHRVDVPGRGGPLASGVRLLVARHLSEGSCYQLVNLATSW